MLLVVLLVPEEVELELLVPVVPDATLPDVPSATAPPGRLTVDLAARAWKFARERVAFAAVLGGC